MPATITTFRPNKYTKIAKIRIEVNGKDAHEDADLAHRCLNVADVRAYNEDGIIVSHSSNGATAAHTSTGPNRTSPDPPFGAAHYAIDDNTGSFNHTHGGDVWLEITLSTPSFIQYLEIRNRAGYTTGPTNTGSHHARMPTTIKLLDAAGTAIFTENPRSWPTDLQKFSFPNLTTA